MTDTQSVPDLSAYDITIMSPDGIPLHPEPYENLNAAVQAAAFFMLRFVHQGYYKTSRCEYIPIEELPKYLELQITPKEEEDDVDHQA